MLSDAWVRALKLETTVGIPAIVVSDEIKLGFEAWVPRFECGPHRSLLLYFGGMTIVNPFNEYAVIRVEELRKQLPAHKSKYDWFLELADAIRRDESLVPQAMLTRMLELGILRDITLD